MTERIIAIGDIHGCCEVFDALLSALELTKSDTLITLGDCIDRGSDSCSVIERLFELSTKCQLVTLMGNHEEMLLTALERPDYALEWMHFGGAATLASYGAGSVDKVPARHVDFIRSWPDYYVGCEHFFAHGNYDPQVELAEQDWQVMRWKSLHVEFPGPHLSGMRAVLGHTSQKTGRVLVSDHLVCIDTYCHGGANLTALDVVSGTLWQADARGNVRTFPLE